MLGALRMDIETCEHCGGTVKIIASIVKKICANPMFSGSSHSGFHRIAYTEWGAADNPRVLICVHGLSRNVRDSHARPKR